MRPMHLPEACTLYSYSRLNIVSNEHQNDILKIVIARSFRMYGRGLVCANGPTSAEEYKCTEAIASEGRWWTMCSMI